MRDKKRKKSFVRPQADRITGDDLEARRLQRLKTGEILRNGRTPLHVVQIAKHGAELADAVVAQAQQREPLEKPLACAAGCSWCCYQRVGTVLPEVVRIVEYLQQHLAPAVLEQLRARVVQLAERRLALRNDPWSAVRLPCPLLEDGRCLAYPVRPLTCRGATSTDAQRCEQAVKESAAVTVPKHTPTQRLTTMILDGTRAGLGEAGLDGELLDLTAALRIALETPAALEQWLLAEKAFASARLPS